MFSGLIITEDNIPSYLIWLFWISPIAWALRSAILLLFYSETFDVEGLDIEIVLQVFGSKTSEAWIAGGFGYLLFFFVLTTLLQIVVLENIRFGVSGKRDGQVGYAENDLNDQITSSVVASTKLDIEGGGLFENELLKFQPLTVVFKNLSYTVKIKKNKTKKLLNDVSGFAYPGKLVALMGSTGAGKTTLMDVIAGRKTGGKIEGQILIDGKKINSKLFKHQVS